MSKIDCRNHLKNGCCILTGGECTHETCTTKEPELQYGNNSKYEEALERARKGMPIDEVFPELKESEDERIRKALIRFFKNTHDWVNLKYDGNEIVAYLEKQKEQKPIISDEAIRDGVAHFGITQYQINNWLKKHINVVEQQPAEWSKEDEEMLDAMIDIVSNSLYEPLCPREGMLAWLKFLPEKIQLSKKIIQ